MCMYFAGHESTVSHDMSKDCHHNIVTVFRGLNLICVIFELSLGSKPLRSSVVSYVGFGSMNSFATTAAAAFAAVAPSGGSKSLRRTRAEVGVIQPSGGVLEAERTVERLKQQLREAQMHVASAGGDSTGIDFEDGFDSTEARPRTAARRGGGGYGAAPLNRDRIFDINNRLTLKLAREVAELQSSVQKCILLASSRKVAKWGMAAGEKFGEEIRKVGCGNGYKVGNCAWSVWASIICGSLQDADVPLSSFCAAS